MIKQKISIEIVGFSKSDRHIHVQTISMYPHTYIMHDHLNLLSFNSEIPCNDNPCASQPCQNGGSCLTMDASYYICVCTDNYLGINCRTLRCKYRD